MDNFKDDKNTDTDNATDHELNDLILSDPMEDVGLITPEDSDIELMSNSDLDVEEIIKIDTTDSEELEHELEKSNGISEKEQMKEALYLKYNAQ